tara:strand:- start:188 stop:496 length:309 start_codon:yes stop_codon:yes gene_type:complete
MDIERHQMAVQNDMPDIFFKWLSLCPVSWGNTREDADSLQYIFVVPNHHNENILKQKSVWSALQSVEKRVTKIEDNLNAPHGSAMEKNVYGPGDPGDENDNI